MLGPQHRIFFGGDSGPYEEGFREIGATYGPFDLTMLEIGAYDAEWADIHMGPEHAIAAHQALGGGLLLPLHWGTFNQPSFSRLD
jgi:L-ascorbate metabolism protein UlaG (beta-lactamase superfamily)